MSSAIRLASVIGSVCPIHGVSIGQEGQAASVRIDFKLEATQQQRTAAQNALAAFDWSDAAQTAWNENQYPERKAIRQAAQQAIADNDAFLAIASPNNAQNAAQVRRLTQECTALIKRLIQL